MVSFMEEKKTLSREQEEIVQWLEKVRFKKQLFGGVSEASVWKKIKELDGLYTKALLAERARYDTLVEHYKALCNETLKKYQKEYEKIYGPLPGKSNPLGRARDHRTEPENEH